MPTPKRLPIRYICRATSLLHDRLESTKAPGWVAPSAAAMARLALLSVLCIALTEEARAGESLRLEMVRSGPVAASNPMAPIVEPHLAIHPENPRHLLAAAMVIEDPHDSVWLGSHIDTFLSRDGGVTWRQQRLDMVAGGDPWVTIDGRGIAFVSYLGQDSEKGKVGLRYRISKDGGTTWGPQLSLGTGHDRETMVSGSVSGRATTFLVSSQLQKTANDGRLTQPFVARSVDGRGFSRVALLLPNNLQSNTLKTVITRQGALVVSLLDYANSSFEMLETRRAWVLVSADAGETFSEPRLVADDTARRTEFTIAADPTGHFASDRIYAIRTVPKTGSGRAIMLSKSDDLGRTWQELQELAGPAQGAEPVGPADVVVGAKGTVFVAWFDGRNGTDEATVDLYVRASTDAGSTFLPPARITEVSSENRSEGNGLVVDRFKSGGDYFGMVPLPSGGVELLWADSRSGVYQLYSARLKLDAGIS